MQPRKKLEEDDKEWGTGEIVCKLNIDIIWYLVMPLIMLGKKYVRKLGIR